MSGLQPTSLTTDQSSGMRHKDGLKMQNLRLTKWLGMVRHALKERDDMKRASLLNAADGFLQNQNQDLETTPPCGDAQKTAA